MIKEIPLSFEEMDRNKTISREIEITGPTPYLPNHRTTVILKPDDTGIIFNHEDLEISVEPKYSADPRGVHATSLEKDGDKIISIEHLLSALTGLGVTSCRIELIGSNQVPMVEFSAKPYTDSIVNVGVEAVDKTRGVIVVKKDIFFEFENSYAILRPSIDKITTVSALIQFPKPIGEQYFSTELNPENYINEVSWARSFIRASCDDKYWEKAVQSVPCLPQKLLDSPIPLFRDEEWVVKPLASDEPVRHKLLDSIGDLSVLGYPIIGNITFIRPGHRFNHFLVKYLSNLLTATE